MLLWVPWNDCLTEFIICPLVDRTQPQNCGANCILDDTEFLYHKSSTSAPCACNVFLMTYPTIMLKQMAKIKCDIAIWRRWNPVLKSIWSEKPSKMCGGGNGSTKWPYKWPFKCTASQNGGMLGLYIARQQLMNLHTLPFPLCQLEMWGTGCNIILLFKNWEKIASAPEQENATQYTPLHTIIDNNLYMSYVPLRGTSQRIAWVVTPYCNMGSDQSNPLTNSHSNLILIWITLFFRFRNLNV